MIRALYKLGLKFSPEASLPHPPSRILSQVFSFLPVHFADCRCDRFFFHLLLFFFFFLVNPFSQGRKRRANSPPPRLPSSLLLFSCLTRRQTKRVIIVRITVPATFHLKQSFRVETPKLCYILYLIYSTYVPLQSTLRIYGRRCWFPFSNKHRFGVRRGRFPSLSPSRSFLGQEKYQCPPSSGSVAIPSGPLARPDTPSPPLPCCLRLSFFDPKGETPSLSLSFLLFRYVDLSRAEFMAANNEERSVGRRKEGGGEAFFGRSPQPELGSAGLFNSARKKKKKRDDHMRTRKKRRRAKVGEWNRVLYSSLPKGISKNPGKIFIVTHRWARGRGVKGGNSPPPGGGWFWDRWKCVGGF